jgi:hypothetical protein
MNISYAQADRPLKDLSLAEIEKAYWVCDYESSKSMLSMGDAATCSFVFEELKSRKFNGDWPAMLAWWKANKDAEYKNQSKKK